MLWKNELNKQGIILYSVANAFDYKNSAPIVERFNRTMRDYMNVERDKKHYPNKHALTNHVVKTFPNIYNNNVHSTMGAKPNEIASGAFFRGTIVNDALQRVNENKNETKEKFNIGDKVYVVKPPPNGIEKKDADKWFRNKFEIEKVLNTNPITYKIKGKDEHYYKKQLRKA